MGEKKFTRKQRVKNTTTTKKNKEKKQINKKKTLKVKIQKK